MLEGAIIKGRFLLLKLLLGKLILILLFFQNWNRYTIITNVQFSIEYIGKY